MKARFKLQLPGLLALSAAWLQTSQPARSAELGPEWNDPDVIPGRVLVKYRPEKARALKAEMANRGIQDLVLTPLEQRAEKRSKSENPNKPFRSILPDHFFAEFPAANRDQVLQRLARDPDVIYFEPDRVREAKEDWGTSTPDDPLLSSLWGMNRIGAPTVWAKQSASRSTVRVAVMEGRRFDDTHEDLTDQVSSAQNHSGTAGNHATWVAGIVAATGNNGEDVVGVANVELVALDPGATSSDFAENISWAVNHDVRVINMSFHWFDSSDASACTYVAKSSTEQDAITAALDDIVFVAAAGNCNIDLDGNGRRPTPASYDGVIGVSGIASDDSPYTLSNFGDYVDLTAPGVAITSTISPNTTTNWAGTSASSPYVAGSAAAVLAIEPGFDVASIPRLLTLTAEDIGVSGTDSTFGAGVVRVDSAVSRIADVYAERFLSPWQDGTLKAPYYSLETAVSVAPSGGRIGCVGSVAPFALSEPLSKPCTIFALGGSVTISN